jgi:hypothetical protein
LLVSILFLPAVGCGGWTPYTAEEPVEATYQVTGNRPKITVEVFNGPIEILADAPGEVRVRVVKRGAGASQDDAVADLDRIEVLLPKEQEGDTFTIVARRKDGHPAGSSGAAAVVHVPERADVELKTSNGRLAVTGPTGTVKGQTSNGPVSVKGAAGAVTANTSNGAIDVKGGLGRLDLRSSNGPITINAAGTAQVTAHTSNGRVTFSGTLAEGENSLTTSNGPVTVTLPPSSRFRIDAQTSNGRVNSAFTLSQKEKTSRSRLQGAVGSSPEGLLKIRTSNGSIELKKGEE